MENNRGAGDISAQGPSLVGVGELAPDFYLRTGRMPLDHAGEEPERQRPFFNDREISAITAYVGSFGGGPPIPEPHPDHGALTEGMSLFTDHCAGCHQIVGEGGYVTGAKVPTLKHADATEIAEAVRIGPYLMPRFPKSQISDDDLNKIIAYVQASKHPEDRGGLGIGHIGPVPEGMVAWLIAGRRPGRRLHGDRQEARLVRLRTKLARRPARDLGLPDAGAAGAGPSRCWTDGGGGDSRAELHRRPAASGGRRRAR